MTLQEVVGGNMDFEFAEPAAKGDVVFDADMLTAKDDHLMLVKRVSYRVKVRVIQLGNINAGNFRAERVRQAIDLHGGLP